MSEDLSKTARKREAERLQLVGRKLTEMKPDVLATIQMSPALREAIATHQRISSREGGRRRRPRCSARGGIHRHAWRADYRDACVGRTGLQ